MPEMSGAQLEEFLAESHVGVLSVSRRDRGPIAVPIWYLYQGGEFRIITSRDSLHGRIMQRTGRATVTVHWEHYGEDASIERYAIAEGPIAFTERDVVPEVLEARRRYYVNARADEWIEGPIPPGTLRQRVAVMRPERLSGFEWREVLP